VHPIILFVIVVLALAWRGTTSDDRGRPCVTGGSASAEAVTRR
jgi:hypothetical protein